MEKFICVRMVQGNGMDLSLFQFDYDMSFAVFFLNADRTIYGRYGTRSNKPKDAHTDISLEGLAEAMKAALALHGEFPANRASLLAKTGPKPRFPAPELLPALAQTGKFGPQLATGDQKTISQSCIHCHQILDAERTFYAKARQPLPQDVLYPWPMPELVGLQLDRKQRASVHAVAPDSPAAAAGFQAGDEILLLDGQPIISLADVQWVLHRAGEGASLEASVKRGEAVHQLALALPSGWRQKSDISWRTSTWDLRRIATGGLLLEDLPPDARSRHDLPADRMALLVIHVGQYDDHAAAKRAGFLKDDVIISYDGITKPWRETDFIAHVLATKQPGATIPVTVLRAGKSIDLKLPVQK